jgi:hypothetical protein
MLRKASQIMVDHASNDWHHCKKRRRYTKIREGHIRMKAMNGEIHLQDKAGS